MQYRRKPDYVNAVFYDGTNWDEVVEGLGADVVKGYEHSMIAGYMYVNRPGSPEIELYNKQRFLTMYEPCGEEIIRKRS